MLSSGYVKVIVSSRDLLYKPAWMFEWRAGDQHTLKRCVLCDLLIYGFFKRESRVCLDIFDAKLSFLRRVMIRLSGDFSTPDCQS
jgi:hypothetical protein